MSETSDGPDAPRAEPADIVREYGPFPGAEHIAGVTHDGTHVWFAAHGRLHALDPETGQVVRALDVACDAGTAFDGTHIYQLDRGRIHRIDPRTGAVLGSIPAPGDGGHSGLAWADGSLWVGQYHGRRIHQIDPGTGAIRRTIECQRFVTGVTWVDGELWHGTSEAGASDIRRVDPRTGEVLARLALPAGSDVSGLESDGGDLLYAGGGMTGKIRAVRRPRRKR